MKLINVILLCGVVIVCVVIALLIVLNQNESEEIKEGKPCVDNEEENGICKPIDQCLPALENYKKKIEPKICGYDDQIAIVCCITLASSDESLFDITTKIDVRNTSNLNSDEEIISDPCTGNNGTGVCQPIASAERVVKKLDKFSNYIRIPGQISKAKCTEYAKYSYREIVSPVLSTKAQNEKLYECHDNVEIPTIGKKRVPRKEVPHMVLLGFSVIRGQILYVCGGNLISENFVLTAASCLFSPNSTSIMYVLFGVTDTESSENRQIINVRQAIRHPKYEEKTRAYNIGLAKLEHPVEINEFVRPACINTVRDIQYKTAVEYEWGVHIITNNSRGIIKSIRDILSHDSCSDQNDDLTICTIATSTQRNDPCLNFQGSSLVVNDHISKKLKCMPLIIGLTVWIGNCGVDNKKIYTRVSEYIDWIERIVWPEAY